MDWMGEQQGTAWTPVPATLVRTHDCSTQVMVHTGPLIFCVIQGCSSSAADKPTPVRLTVCIKLWSVRAEWNQTVVYKSICCTFWKYQNLGLHIFFFFKHILWCLESLHLSRFLTSKMLPTYLEATANFPYFDTKGSIKGDNSPPSRKPSISSCNNTGVICPWRKGE